MKLGEVPQTGWETCPENLYPFDSGGDLLWDSVSAHFQGDFIPLSAPAGEMDVSTFSHLKCFHDAFLPCSAGTFLWPAASGSLVVLVWRDRWKVWFPACITSGHYSPYPFPKVLFPSDHSAQMHDVTCRPWIAMLYLAVFWEGKRVWGAGWWNGNFLDSQHSPVPHR